MRLLEVAKEEWNKFIGESVGSQILQTWEWGEVKRSQGWEPIRMAVEDEGKVVAQVSILKRKLPYTNKCIFYAPRGPIIGDFLLEAIKKEAKKHGAIVLKIDPEIENDEIFKKQGFRRQRGQIQPRATFFIDLTCDLDTLILSFEEKTRYNIRLAERKGVQVKELSGQVGVDVFHELYRETAGRDNFLIHPKSYYQKIFNLMGPAGMVRIFIAYFEDEPIAATINFAFGGRIWYMYGASKSSHRNVMPNHALHWEIIKKAKEEGFKLYDLWGIPSNPHPDHPLYGVYRFKKGFNGRLIKYVGCLDLVYDPLFYFLFDKGLTWFKNIRSLILKGKISDSLSE